jgi:hypothetical protein
VLLLNFVTLQLEIINLKIKKYVSRRNGKTNAS